MPARRRGQEDSGSRGKPATTPEERENELIVLAQDLAERQLRDGTASSQVITQYLKLGSTRERLEQQKIEHENQLTQAKIEGIAAQARIEELYLNALNAMRSYGGQNPPQEEEDEESELP